MIKIFPAIDIKDGRVVRLTYGDYQQMQVYALSAADALAGFEQAGANYVHIVDLDGAKDGKPGNFATIAPLLKKTKLFCEIGGGIRTRQSIESYLNAGAGRVILGTSAIEDKSFLAEMIGAYQEHIAVGVDARDSKVAVAGWLTTTDIDSFDFCEQLLDIGVSSIIYTDISRDGAMQGCNLAAYERLSKLVGLDIVASGGISSLNEIEKLRDMGISGAILGKALYNGLLDLAEVLSVARGENR